MKPAAAALSLFLAGCAFGPANVLPLSVDAVVERHKTGATSQQLIQEIEVTGTRFYLTTADVVALRESGVPDTVIDRMLSTAWRPARIYYHDSWSHGHHGHWWGR